MPGSLGASRQKGIEHRVVLVLVLEQVGHHMRQIINGADANTLIGQQSYRFCQIGAAVLDNSHRLAHNGNHAFEHLGHALAGP